MERARKAGGRKRKEGEGGSQMSDGEKRIDGQKGEIRT